MSEHVDLPGPRPGSRYHGDEDADAGMLDFAVNVRHDAPPAWLRRRLAGRLGDVARYPGRADRHAAVSAVAARHGVPAEHVLLLAGGSEGFSLLPALQPRLAAIVAPSFTEPEAVFAAAAIPVRHEVLAPPFQLAGAAIGDDADLVVVGNPTNPTGVLHRREALLALRRPGRLVVVDEAFADAVPGEPESLAGGGHADVLVLRSLTKTWALAGLRVGYAIGDPAVLHRLSSRQPHWPLGTLQLEAIAACCGPQAVAAARTGAHDLEIMRVQMAEALRDLGLHVVDGRAPFILFGVPDPALTRKRLRARGINVRRCDTFRGLPDGYLRAAVRTEWPVLIEALREVLG